MDLVTIPGDAPDRTVGQVAGLLQVTVRALHHWDEIGLASPSLRSSAGYRLYSPADVDRLRRVLVHRELGLGLEEIRRVLDDPTTDPVTVLRAQRSQLAVRIERLRCLDDDVQKMIDAHEHGITIPVDQQAEAFGSHWDPSWPEQARQRWGDSESWRRYAEQAAGRDATAWRATADAVAAFERTLADAAAAGVRPGTSAADALVDEHRTVFAAWFPITRQQQVLLARRYAVEPAFRDHHERIRPGLADWFRAVVEASARRHGIDPDSASWE
jgi:MerR family transcriptional regulator, thiopeptide resistance regulator